MVDNFECKSLFRTDGLLIFNQFWIPLIVLSYVNSGMKEDKNWRMSVLDLNKYATFIQLEYEVLKTPAIPQV